jgi:hypothetical protein
MCEDFLLQMQNNDLGDQAQTLFDWAEMCLQDLNYYIKCSPNTNRLSFRVPRRDQRSEGRAFLTVMVRKGHFVYHLNTAGVPMAENWISLDYDNINKPEFCRAIRANYDMRLNL